MALKKENKLQKGSATGVLIGDFVIVNSSDNSRLLFDKSAFGTKFENNAFKYMLEEACYLAEKQKLIITDGRNKEISFEKLIFKVKKHDKRFLTRYAVYKDLRERGYVVKTGLKFGAEFRVYDRGIQPGKDHAKWIVFPVKERDRFSWYEFSAKNRVANSTKKRLLIAIVDDESDVTYYECKWLKP